MVLFFHLKHKHKFYHLISKIIFLQVIKNTTKYCDTKNAHFSIFKYLMPSTNN